MSRQHASVLLAPQVLAFLSRLSREPRKAIRSALHELGRERGDVKPLEGHLEGYHRLRVGAYRVIFRYGTSKSGRPVVSVIFAERRSMVYLLVEDMMRRGLVRNE